MFCNCKFVTFFYVISKTNVGDMCFVFQTMVLLSDILGVLKSCISFEKFSENHRAAPEGKWVPGGDGDVEIPCIYNSYGPKIRKKNLFLK